VGPTPLSDSLASLSHSTAAAASPVVDVFILFSKKKKKKKKEERRQSPLYAVRLRERRERETRTFLICCRARRASVQLVRVNRSDSFVVVVVDDDLLYGGGLFL
jgi:hypothetical protein